ncbi:hypothetical protein C7408_11388 [Paraburkholderia caballeronis]|nr:hypothetical protein C7408_11388 [Paraburkholderia caballeronis]TDV14235.1 hypothetical protein C7406_11470 [Paraburkholderia caballeronis]TDV23400.1 hypothetical protein C7404_11370 [Paraburkholderia caballeronis]
MEETGTTIHSALPRCNNFLRENPQIVWFHRDQPGWVRAGRPSPRMTPQDPARTTAAARLQWSPYQPYSGVPT